jgi:hypothetical protein
MMAPPLDGRISPDAENGWHWEIRSDEEVVARGLAETYAAAIIEVAKITRHLQRKMLRSKLRS